LSTCNRDRSATVNAKLVEERGHVNLDRTLSEVEGARYLLVGTALHDQAQNIALAAGQHVDSRRH
jgi:hypothetical protein